MKTKGLHVTSYIYHLKTCWQIHQTGGTHPRQYHTSWWFHQFQTHSTNVHSWSMQSSAHLLKLFHRHPCQMLYETKLQKLKFWLNSTWKQFVSPPCCPCPYSPVCCTSSGRTPSSPFSHYGPHLLQPWCHKAIQIKIKKKILKFPCHNNTLWK